MVNDSLDRHDDLHRPALPQEDLPEDDDVELEDDTAETEPQRQPQAMPGWFKVVLLLLALALMGAGATGYLYLTGGLNLGTTGTSVHNDPWEAPVFAQESDVDGQGSEPSNGVETVSAPTEPLQTPTDANPALPEAYAIHDPTEPEARLNLDVSLPAPSLSAPPERRAHQASATNDNDRMDLPMGVLADLREGLANIEQILVGHREELKRLNSLIANNEISIQNQAEDLALLSARVTKANQAARSTPAPRKTTPELNIALVSMQQMGSAQAVGVRYRGRDQRLQLGQSIDGWRLSAVQIDNGTAQFTHTASNHTVTVAL